LVLLSVPLPAAAAAAVAMPANASSSPQARIERRNSKPPGSIASRRPSGREGAPFRRAPLGAAYAVVPARIATGATFVLCKDNACDSASGHFGAKRRWNVRRCDESCVKQHRAYGDPDCAPRGAEAREPAARRRRGDARDDQTVAERASPDRAERDADDRERPERVPGDG